MGYIGPLKSYASPPMLPVLDSAFKGQFFRIKSVTLSPEYTKRDGVWIFKKGDPKKTSKFDIAVLETLTPIRFNDNVKAIEIATEKPSADTPVFVGGWGVNTVSEGGAEQKQREMRRNGKI